MGPDEWHQIMPPELNAQPTSLFQWSRFSYREKMNLGSRSRAGLHICLPAHKFTCWCTPYPNSSQWERALNPLQERRSVALQETTGVINHNCLDVLLRGAQFPEVRQHTA